MSMTQYFGRAGLSMLVVGALLGACGDDGDTGTSDGAETADGGATTPRAGSGGSARAGRGGSAAGGNTASAGRGGTAGAATVAGSGGTAANSGGRGGSVAAGGTTAAGGNGGTTAPSDQDAGTGETANLTDSQIAQVLSAVNTAETSAGNLAVMRATAPATRAFAQSMVEMHATAQERQAALFNTLNLTLAPSDVTTKLSDEASTEMTKLMGLSGLEFDQEYLGSQLNAHNGVLKIIDDQLLPSVVADTLRAELVLTRTTVVTHVDAARTALTVVQADTDGGIAP